MRRFEPRQWLHICSYRMRSSEPRQGSIFVVKRTRGVEPGQGFYVCSHAAQEAPNASRASLDFVASNSPPHVSGSLPGRNVPKAIFDIEPLTVFDGSRSDYLQTLNP